jgi:hypothetical protein
MKTHLKSVDQWRGEQLVAAGFDERLALRLAGDARIELHALIELVERGCQPELAARIFAPIDAPLRRVQRQMDITETTGGE